MRSITLLIAVAMLLCSSAVTLPAQGRRRVAVSTDSSVPQDRLAIATMVENALLEKLANERSIEMIDRSHLQSLFAEQNMAYSDRIDPTDVAKIGKLKGVDILVIVKIPDFDENASEVVKSRIAYLQITDTGSVHLSAGATVITVERGSIISAPISTVDPPVRDLHSYKAMDDGTTVVKPKTSQEVMAENRPAMSQLIGKAVSQAADEIYSKMQGPLTTAPLGLAPVAKVSSSLTVAGIYQGNVYVTQGASNGLKVGDRFQVFRSIDTGLKHPDSGQPIFRKNKICVLVLADVDETSASGTCQGGVPQKDDQVTAEGAK